MEDMIIIGIILGIFLAVMLGRGLREQNTLDVRERDRGDY